MSLNRASGSEDASLNRASGSEDASLNRAIDARWGEARRALLDEGGRERPPLIDSRAVDSSTALARERARIDRLVGRAKGGPMNVYGSRRQQLMERIGPRAVAVIGGKKPSLRNGDVEHRFRADERSLVPHRLHRARGAGGDRARSRREVHAVRAAARSRARDLDRPARRRRGRHGQVRRRPGVPRRAARGRAAQAARRRRGDPVRPRRRRRPRSSWCCRRMAQLRQGERRGMRAPRRIGDLRWTLHELRLIKDADASPSCAAPSRSLARRTPPRCAAARDGVNEYEIEALIDYTFRKHGGHPGYGTIVGGGVNATILHYVDNDQPLQQGRASAHRRRLRDRRLHRRRHADLSDRRALLAGAAALLRAGARRREDVHRRGQAGHHHRRHPRAGGRAA